MYMSYGCEHMSFGGEVSRLCRVGGGGAAAAG